MHIPDGFLDSKSIVATSALSLIGVAHSLRTLKRDGSQRQVVGMGLAAAFIFTAQMINFPIVGGTSGHLVGGTLATVLLGPEAAVVVLTAVLIIQSLVFADGGMLALGANVLNMAIVTVYSSYWSYLLVKKVISRRIAVVSGSVFAGWVSIVTASIACSGELAWAGVARWSTVLTAMVNIHMLIGIAEGVITGLVIGSIAKARPGFLALQRQSSVRGGWDRPIIQIALAGIVFLIFVAPFSSLLPDGLDATLERFGMHGTVPGTQNISPLQDYSVPGITSPVVATIVAGIAGSLFAFGAAVLIGRSLSPKEGRTVG